MSDAALSVSDILAGKRRISADKGTSGSVPVVGIEVLVLMKLRASRMQDLADVEALVRAGADVGAVLAFLGEHGARHVPAFGRIAQRALLV